MKILEILSLILGREASAQVINLTNPLTTDSFADLIKNLTTFIAGFVGSLAVLAFVYAAVIFLTSRGEPSQFQKARKIVWYATIGIAVALAGSALVNLVTYIISGR